MSQHAALVPCVHMYVHTTACCRRVHVSMLIFVEHCVCRCFASYSRLLGIKAALPIGIMSLSVVVGVAAGVGMLYHRVACTCGGSGHTDS